MKLEPYYDKIRELYPIHGKEKVCKMLGLTEGQVIYIKNKLGITLNSEARSQISTKHNGQRKGANDKFNVDHNEFLKLDTLIKCYNLGLLWADGYTLPKTGAVALSSTFPDANYFYKNLSEIGNWNIYSRFIKNQPTWKESAMIKTNNKYLVRGLFELGFDNRLAGMDKVFRRIGGNLLPGFLLGLSDGDGCFFCNIEYFSYTFCLCSGHDQNWDILSKFLNEKGINHSIKRVNGTNGNCSKLHISGKYEVAAWGDILYSGHDLGLARKKERFLNIKSRCEKPRMKSIELADLV